MAAAVARICLNIILVLALLVTLVRGSGSVPGGHGRELYGSGKLIDCAKACSVRCKGSHWTHKRCMKNCGVCCKDCNCVPVRHMPKFRKGKYVNNCSCYQGMGHFCP